VDSEELVAERAGHQDWIRAVAFASGSPLLASGSGDGSVYLWNVADGHLALLRSNRTRGRVRAVSVSPDGGVVRAAGEDATLQTINADGVTSEVKMPDNVDWIRAIADIGEGETVIGCEDGGVRLVRAGHLSDLANGRDTVWSTVLVP
jgi:WD40 repeat protein